MVSCIRKNLNDSDITAQGFGIGWTYDVPEIQDQIKEFFNTYSLLKGQKDLFIQGIKLGAQKSNKDISTIKLDSIINQINSNSNQNTVQEEPLANTPNSKLDVPNSLSTFVDNYYGTNIGAYTRRQLKFNDDIVRNTILNGDQLIFNGENLNSSLLKLQDQYYKIIRDYLDDDTLPESLYTTTGEVNPNYVNTISKFQDILKSKTKEQLNSEINSGWLSDINNLDKGITFYKALNAYTNLLYFDSGIKEILGNSIGIDKDSFNTISNNKYSFNRDNGNKVAGWWEPEFSNALKYVSNFSKTLISIIPVINYKDKIDTNTKMSLNVFANAFTKLLDYINQYSTDQDLKDAVNDLQSSPRQSIETILNKLFNDKDSFRTYIIPVNGDLNLNDSDINVLYSVYNQVYDKTNKASFASIEDNSIKNGYGRGRYSLVDTILGVILRNNRANYLNTVASEDGTITDTKSKYDINRRLFNNKQLINYRVNSLDTDSVTKQYPITIDGTTKLNLKLGSYNLELTNNNGTSLDKDYSDMDLSITKDRQLMKVSLTDPDFPDKYPDLYKSVSDYINDMLGINLNDEVIKQLKKINPNYLRDILINSLQANTWYKLMSDSKQSDSNTFKDYVVTLFPSIGSINTNTKKFYSYFTNNGTDYNPILVSNVTKWLQDYSLAESIYYGDDNKSIYRDLTGNAIGGYRSSYLGGQIKHKLKQYNDDPQATPFHSLMFTSNPDLIKDVVFDTDVQLLDGTKKSIREFNTVELINHAIFDNFYNSYNTNKTFSIQATAYSDKTSFIQVRIRANNTFNGKTLSTATIEDLIKWNYDTLGNAYKNTLKNTLHKLASILIVSEESVEAINEALHRETEQSLVSKAQKLGMKVTLDTDYRINKDGTLRFNELLDWEANTKYFSYNSIAKELEYQEKLFVQDLLKAGIVFYDSDNIRNAINNFIDNPSDFESKWFNAGRLIIAKQNGKNIMYGNIDLNEDIEINPLLRRYFYTDTLLSNNLRFTYTGSEIAHPNKAKINWNAELLKEGLAIVKQPEDWIAFKKNIYNGTDVEGYLKVYNRVMRQIQNVAEGTQFKREVIITATQQTEQATIDGILPTAKVAFIRDVPANVFNFNGDVRTEDSHDGSAFINPYASILENNSLQDQAVGWNKKHIWHDIDHTNMSDILLKFAAYTITNEWMRKSLGSDISLYKLFQKMNNFDISDIDLTNTMFNTTFSEYLQNEPLYYEFGDQNFQIVDFGKEGDTYYTIENEVSSDGTIIRDNIKVYHYFAGNNHIRSTELKQNSDTISNLWQLQAALGGIFSKSLVGDNLQYSEASNYAVVWFMNNVGNVKDEKGPLDQSNYEQPLKQRMISYAANLSGTKNGAQNLNSKEAWYDDNDLTYTTLRTDGLGPQMDADHNVDESQLTEFSQVISALEAGGLLHDVVKQTYQDLGKLSLEAVGNFDNAIDEFVSGFKENPAKAKSQLYDIIGRIIINNFKLNRDRVDLAGEIISAIASIFNVNEDHLRDELKIPFSDSNLYSFTLSTIVSQLNKTAIKKKFPGSGCVLLPSYGIIQTWKIDGIPYQFQDLYKYALENTDLDPTSLVYPTDQIQYAKAVVDKFLQQRQNDIHYNPSTEQYMPTDIVDYIWTDENGEKHTDTYSLDTPDHYYLFKGITLVDNEVVRDSNQTAFRLAKGIPLDADLQFRMNITRPKSLAPSKISWSYVGLDGNEHTTNIFNQDTIIKTFFNKEPNYYAVQKVMQDIYKKVQDGTYFNFVNNPAELVMSKLYASKFRMNADDSLSEILRNPQDYFRARLKDPYQILNDKFSLIFSRRNNHNLYISFDQQDADWKEVKFNRTRRDEDDVYYTDENGNNIFQIGKDVLRSDLTLSGTQVLDEDGNVVIPNIETVSNYIIKDNKVYEYIPIVTRQQGVIQGRKGPLKYFIYNIDTEQAKKNNINIGKLLQTIYKSEDFLGAEISLANYPSEEVSEYIDTLKEVLSEDNKKFIDTLGDIMIIPEYKTKGRLNSTGRKAYRTALKEYTDSIINQIASSFDLSTLFVSARIPAQTLQSFMQMRLVGYSDTQDNVAYVSPWQTYLQGSDYRL